MIFDQAHECSECFINIFSSTFTFCGIGLLEVEGPRRIIWIPGGNFGSDFGAAATWTLEFGISFPPKNVILNINS